MQLALADALDLTSMDDAELKKAFQSMSAHAAMAIMPEYLELVQASDDPEVKRKALVMFTENAALKAAQPREGERDYPVLNFNIGSAVKVTATDAKGETHTLEFTPSEVMAASTYVNADVDFDD